MTKKQIKKSRKIKESKLKAAKATTTKAVKGASSKSKKETQVREVQEEIQKRFGQGSIMRLGEARRVDVNAIPTGSVSLDLALGVGGVPRGRVIEIFGPESSGKTTLALHLASEVQKQGGTAAYIDAEHALDPGYAQKIGVNIDDLLISQPDTGEEALDIVETLVRSDVVDLIVVDSVPALTPRAEIEGRMDEQQIGLQARLMSKALRKLAGAIAGAQSTAVFLNQTRMKIGIMFGNPETTPGGMALKFFSSVRIRLARTAKIQKGSEIIGNRVVAKVVKNKVAPPFREAEFDILYAQGIARLNDLIKTAETLGLIERKGSWYQLGQEKLGPGLEGAARFLEENSELEKSLLDQVKKVNLGS
jgi:recombination protein RecA